MEKLIWNEAKPYAAQRNDVVLLKLETPLVFNENVSAACLPPANYNPVNTKCYTSGWGHLSHSGKSPDNLQWVDVPILSSAKCRSKYPGSYDEESMVVFFSDDFSAFLFIQIS